MADDPDFYALLELPRSASEDAIRQAVTREQRVWSRRASNAPNPADRRAAEQRVEEISAARRNLLDRTAKALYDRSLQGIASEVPGGPPQTPIRIAPPPSLSREPQAPNVAVTGGLGPRLWHNRPLRWVTIAFVVLVIISASQSGSGPAPLPSNVPRAAVFRAVVDGLRSCAQSAVLQPANCPQQASASSGTAVLWSLHGDPTSGAQINSDSGKVTVLGHAVMTLAYSDSSGTRTYKVVDVSYQAELALRGNQASLTSITPLQNEPTPPIIEARPSDTDDAVKAAVKSAFAKCIAAALQPDRCQIGGSLASSDTNVHWSLQADPLLNSRVTFNADNGTLHVIGSDALKVTYTDSSGTPGSQDFQGTYDATVTRDGRRLGVLDILTQ